MPDIDEIVKRLSEITDALLALKDDDFAVRFKLETERDALRAQAEEFHQRKDQGRPSEELITELRARKEQLEQIRDGYVNRATQASASSARGGGSGAPLGAEHGGNVNNAMSQAQGTGTITARIAELEQELTRRAEAGE